MMTTTTQKRILMFKVLAPIIAVFITLVLLETGLRILEQFSTKTTRKEQRIKMIKEAGRLYPPPNQLFSRVLERERLGHKNFPSMGISLREYDYPVSKPEHSYRIIGLGDSFAWGWGVTDNRRTTFKYLESWLNADNKEQYYELINCAQPAKSVKYYEDFVREYGGKFNPDMFIILYNLNDSYLPHASMVVDKRAKKLMQQQKDSLSSISKLYSLIKTRIVKKKVHNYTVSHIKEGYFGPGKQHKWGKAKNNFKEIQKLCQERKIELIVAIFPLLFELEKKYPFQDEVDEVDSFLKSNRIKTVNLLPAFKGKKTFTLWASPTDSHPNRVAHRLAAEAVYQFLHEQVFTSCTSVKDQEPGSFLHRRREIHSF